MKRFLILFLFLSICLMNVGSAKADTNSDFDIQNGVLVKYNGNDEEVIIPDGVTSIGEGAFSGCTSLTSITITEEVTSIGDFSFYDCSSLTSVTIPASVKSIGIGVFVLCTNLTTVTFEDGIKDIDTFMFMYCDSLSDVYLPQSMSYIDSRMFYNGNDEDDGVIRSAVTVHIDERNSYYASVDNGNAVIEKATNSLVYGNRNLTLIPDYVTSIGDYAFCSRYDLTSITIPEGVTSIGSFSFSGCNSLTNITLPYGVTFIGEGAFNGCSNLTDVTIPNSVTLIGYSAFRGCSSLTSITIPESVTFIGGFTFMGCRSLTNVILPMSLTDIGDSAFYGCSSLKNITIPENVYDIGSSTFSGCTSLSEITLPQSVISLGTYLFSGCNSLSKVYILNGKARGGEGTFPIDGVVYYVERNSDIESELKQLGATVAYLNPPESIDLKGYAVSISEKINLQFYYDIAESDIAGGDIFAKVNYPNGSIKRVYFDVNKKTIQDGKTYYAIECELAAKEMNDQVKIQLWNSETKKSCSEKVQYSVKEYLDDLLVFSSESEAEENLVNAMLTYGAYSQAYFQYDTENLATELLSDYLTENVSSVNAYLNTLASDECVGELPEGISLYGYSLILESTIGYRLYFQADNSDTAKAYGLTYDTKEGYYYTELFSLSPLELNDLFEFKLGDATIRSCPLRYVTYALGENRSDELKQLCVAIVNYHRAAEEYATYLENCSRNGTEILN